MQVRDKTPMIPKSVCLELIEEIEAKKAKADIRSIRQEEKEDVKYLQERIRGEGFEEFKEREVRAGYERVG